MSDSPDSSVDWRFFRLTDEARAPTAAASVGARAAAHAKAAARGMEGTNQFSTKPTTSTVSSTSPTASDRMAPLFSHSSRGSVLRASLNRSGAMNSTRNNSEEMCTSWMAGTKSATAQPTAICTSGSERRGTTWHRTAEPITQASTTRASSSISTMPPFALGRGTAMHSAASRAPLALPRRATCAQRPMRDLPAHHYGRLPRRTPITSPPCKPLVAALL